MKDFCQSGFGGYTARNPLFDQIPFIYFAEAANERENSRGKKDACSGCSARMKFTEFLLLSLVVLSVASDVSYFMGNAFGIVSNGGAVRHKSATVLPGNLPYLSLTTAG